MILLSLVSTFVWFVVAVIFVIRAVGDSDTAEPPRAGTNIMISTAPAKPRSVQGPAPIPSLRVPGPAHKQSPAPPIASQRPEDIALNTK